MRKWQEVQKLPRKEHLIKSFLSNIKKPIHTPMNGLFILHPYQ